MTRVSSFGYNQNMINSLLQNQSRLVTAQGQVSTGKRANTYTQLGADISPLLSADTVKSQIDTHLANTNTVLDKLNFNDLYIGNVYDQTDSLRTSLLDGLSSGSFSSFGETLQQTFDSVVNGLNAQVGGTYIFGGTRSDTPPVSVDTLSDLSALTDASEAFQNSTIKPSAKVDTGTTVQYGMLASDIGTQVMQVLKDFADFQAGPDGPLDGQLTDTQKTFVTDELAKLKTAMQGVDSAAVENGIRTNKMEDLRDSHEASQTVLTTFIGNKEDVDMATAVTQMQQSQVALQASLQVVSQLSQLSLLDYI